MLVGMGFHLFWVKEMIRVENMLLVTAAEVYAPVNENIPSRNSNVASSISFQIVILQECVKITCI